MKSQRMNSRRKLSKSKKRTRKNSTKSNSRKRKSKSKRNSRKRKSTKSKKKNSKNLKKSKSKKRKYKNLDSGDEEKKGDEKIDRYTGDVHVKETSPNKKYIKENEIIGKGSYKVVYKGFDLENGSEIAWSRINLIPINKKEKERLLNEIHLLQKIFENKKFIQFNPPHIIKILNTWYNKDKKEVVIITHLYPEGNLLNYIKNYFSILNFSIIKRWIKQILEGLIFLHTNNIIHRDLKLDNILIDSKTSDIYLADFGLSIEASNSKESVGTLNYMAPEMFKDEIYDNSVDMYAFGICLLEILTNEEVYEECGNNISKIIYNKENNILPLSLKNVRNSELNKLIMKLLSGNIEERPSAYDIYTSNIFE